MFNKQPKESPGTAALHPAPFPYLGPGWSGLFIPILCDLTLLTTIAIAATPYDAL